MTYLCNGIVTLNDWQDGLHLNGRWLGETVAVNASKYIFLQSHIIELVN